MFNIIYISLNICNSLYVCLLANFKPDDTHPVQEILPFPSPKKMNELNQINRIYLLLSI
jgi:hypothetical protein